MSSKTLIVERRLLAIGRHRSLSRHVAINEDVILIVHYLHRLDRVSSPIKAGHVADLTDVLLVVYHRATTDRLHLALLAPS